MLHVGHRAQLLRRASYLVRQVEQERKRDGCMKEFPRSGFPRNISGKSKCVECNGGAGLREMALEKDDEERVARGCPHGVDVIWIVQCGFCGC